MKFSLPKKSGLKKLAAQSDKEKMVLLSLEARRMLGQKWDYFQKIKQAGKSDGLFAEKSILKEMKATQSALKFTSKNALRQYNVAYQNCLKEIKKFAVTDETFADLPDETDKKAVKAMIPNQDGTIIAWTPIKFLLPAKFIRDKGTASQRHTEGLLAKLTFKLVGFYAAPENWDNRRLSFYLHKITAESTYQEVAEKLEPLKKDLSTFSEEFQPFSFGGAALSSAITADSGAFDDAMEVESFESQVKTLYWYSFIYKALESFMTRYYLTLVTSTASRHAIKYLTNIFQPALSRVIDLSILFDGSFDTDRSKKSFRTPFLALKKTRRKEPLIKSIKTKRRMYESYSYILPMVSKFGTSSRVRNPDQLSSFWRRFLETNCLGRNRIDFEKELSYTPFQSLGAKISELEDQNASFSGPLAEYLTERKNVKSQLDKLTRELSTLENAYRDQKPEDIRRELANRKSTADAERQRLEKERKVQAEKKKAILEEQRNLAGVRDNLFEEEGQIKEKENEFNKTRDSLEKELIGMKSKLSELEKKRGKGGDATPEAHQKASKTMEICRADIEQKGSEIKEVDFRLIDIRKNLASIVEKRENEITTGFEVIRKKEEAALRSIEVLEGALLSVRQELTLIGEEQVALEEQDTRFTESKKTLETALKTAEKDLERVLKALDNAREAIEQNKQEIVTLKDKQEVVKTVSLKNLENLNGIETRSVALTYILSTLIVCSEKRKSAWAKVLERFKERIIADQELAKKEVEAVKKEAQKKIRDMSKKASKLKQLKQEQAAAEFQAEIETYQKGVDVNCRHIIKNAKEDASIQKQRIATLFKNVSSIKKKDDAAPARYIVEALLQMEEGAAFKKDFMKILIHDTAAHYEDSLKTLYQSLFKVFNPTLLNRVGLIQALEKSGADVAVIPRLTEEEQRNRKTIIQGIKNQMKLQKKDVFEMNVSIQSTKVSLESLLNLKIDADSLKLLVSMKLTSASTPAGEKLDPSLGDKLVYLNTIINPVTEHHLVLAGKDGEKDPMKRLDIAQFKKIVAAASF